MCKEVLSYEVASVSKIMHVLNIVLHKGIIFLNTVKPVLRGHPWEGQKVAA